MKKILIVSLLFLCLCITGCESEVIVDSGETDETQYGISDSNEFGHVAVKLYDSEGNEVINAGYTMSQSLDLIYLKPNEIYTLELLTTLTGGSTYGYVSSAFSYIVYSLDDILIERDESTIILEEIILSSGESEQWELIKDDSVGVGYQISSENSGVATICMWVATDNSDDPYLKLFLNIIFED